MMYFGMRKQKRQVAEVKRMQDSLTVPGARVMTTSGLHGTVTAVADDTIELEIAPGLRTTWVRAAVREVVVAGPTERVRDIESELNPARRRGSTRRLPLGRSTTTIWSAFDRPGPRHGPGLTGSTSPGAAARV